MFDLNKSIRKWKRSLNKQRFLEDGYKEELSSHFTDLINEGIKNRLSEEEAFKKAILKIGDLKEINTEYSKSDLTGFGKTNSWYGQLFISALILNYIKIAFRNFSKNKGYSFINTSGLAIGLTVVFFVALYINYETSFDKQFKDSDRIYRVVKDFVLEDGIVPDATTPPALAPALKSSLPEVDATLRIMPTWGSKYLISYGDKKFYEENVLKADSNFFEIFNADVVRGSINKALEKEDAVVITESVANKYFGDNDPVGKTVQVEISGNNKDKVVKAVIKDFPENTHFNFDFLIPMHKGIDNNWGWYNYYTYIKLNNNVYADSLDSKIQKIFKKNVPERDHRYFSQKLTDIHLYSNLKWELKNNGSVQHVYSFVTIALLVLLIAGINYINLATAKSSSRSKEVGLRKVSGASRPLLIKQFLIESTVTTLISFAFSLLCLFIILPYLNELFGTNLRLFAEENILLIFLMFGFAVFIGLVSGIYPALYLSGFQAAYILKGIKSTKGGGVWLRQGLVGLQFVISIVLIGGTLIVNKQINFIRTYDIGFEKEQVVVLPNIENLSDFNAFKNELKKSPLINNVAPASCVIGRLNWTKGLRKKGAENDVLTNFHVVDHNLLDVLKMKIVEGRFFSEKFPADYENKVVLSQNAVKEMAIEEPAVGKKILWGKKQDSTIYAEVIGVVKDFNFTSLHQAVKPFAFVMDNRQLENALVKTNGNNYNKILSFINKTWKKYFPEKPFEYYFLDESFDKLHQADVNFGKVFNLLTAIAIFIACLGLFALTAFTIEKRTKEIGIRKVLGASSSSILFMLTSDVLKLIVISAFIAGPITYFLMTNWLNEFAYKTSIPAYVFVVSSALIIAISLITISIQTIKTTFSNPINSLRNE